MGKKKSNNGFIVRLLLVVVVFWVALDFLIQALLEVWKPTLLSAFLILLIAIIISVALLGDKISEAL